MPAAMPVREISPFLTDTHAHAPSADAIVFSPDGKQIAWMEEVDGYRQLWVTQTGR
ncbi:hypothetical protein LNN83_20550 [Klebsiella pneumoniae subsp. pneumoniae]|nr:hypothetical protein [Klebsiella pneumoniae subsp. pneumoniae]